MDTPSIARHKTALHRTDLSRPVRLALQDGLITPHRTVFDYGCGRGGDIKRLRRRHIDCAGWDPNFRPDTDKIEADVVNIGYVVNVIEDPDERNEALTGAWALTRHCLVVSARLRDELRSLAEVEEFEDGVITNLGTFQKFYDQSELRVWINEQLEVEAVPAAPGVFYVFRHEADRQTFIASRYRRRAAAPRIRHSDRVFEQHRPLFDALIAFFTERGRLPDPNELPEAQSLIAATGSLPRAWRVVLTVTDETDWDTLTHDRAQDLLIHLALARFSRRPNLSLLPADMQLDVKAFFGTYTKACAAADALLFSAGDLDTVNKAMRQAPVGKLTPGALYLHHSVLDRLDPVLRVYEGCARAYIGDVEGTNIIKLHREHPKVSYLAYPDFDTDPHPALLESLVVPLQTFRVRVTNYHRSTNPPVLHRKEEFVGEDYPGREKFARLTAQEERHGLFVDTNRIGTREGWEEVLRREGWGLRGHRLVAT